MANKNKQSRLLRAIVSLFVCAMLAPQVFAQTKPADVEAAFARATQLHEAGDIIGAIRGYETILASHPNRPDVLSNLGAAYSRLGRYEDAIAQYKKALALDSANHAIRFNLAIAYYKAALFTEAANELNLFLNTAPKSLPQRQNAMLLLGDCRVRLGDYKKVIEMLSPIAEAEPDNRTVAYILGSALIGDGQLDKGQLLIDRVFRDERSAEARLLIGSILLLADDGQGAIKELERAIELNPKLPTLRAWYGRALMRMGDSEKARAAFKGELADNPTDFDANIFLGILLRQDKQFDESFNYLSRAVRLRPRDQYARYHLGAVYMALGKPNDAQPLLEGVVKEFPEFIEARVLLASVYYRLNRKEDGDREQAMAKKLTAAEQAKQPGAKDAPKQNAPVKPPDNLNNQNQQKERQ